MNTTSTETIAQIPAVAELAEWVKTLPNREALTIESIGAEIARRFNTVDSTSNVTAAAIVDYGVARLGGTYDEFRAEAGL